MNYNEEIKEVRKNIQNSNYGIAQEKLLEMLKEYSDIKLEDEEGLHFTFNNYEEYILFRRYNRVNKPLIAPRANMGEIYYELGYICVGLKEFEKAIHYFDEAFKWNPIDPYITFEKAAAYRMMGRIERFRAELTKVTDVIYNSAMVAKYFREMGWYYSEREEFDLANALYSKSLVYMDTKLARDELAYIAKRQNRNVRIDDIKDATKIIAEYNLSNGFRKVVVDTFMQQLEFLKNKEVKEQADWNNIDTLKKALYDITLDKKYMIYIPLSCKEYGIQLDMPIIWKILKKDSYKEFGLNENTVAVFMISNDKKFSIMYDRECTPENLEAAYTENIENMKKYGITILNEDTLNEDGKKMKEVLVECEVEGKKEKLLQYFLILNGKLFKVSWEVPPQEAVDTILNVERKSFRMIALKSIRKYSDETDGQVINPKEEFEDKQEDNSEN